MATTQVAAEVAPEEKEREGSKRRFKVEINKKLCKGCYFCVHYCPVGVFAKSEEIGELGYSLAKVEFPEKCTGCRLCLLYCPDLAIAVEQEKSEKK